MIPAITAFAPEIARGGFPAASSGAREPMPFAGVFQDILAGTQISAQKAQTEVMGVLSGNGTDIHQAMIATQKADIAFEFALQARNKAVGAFQQMMSMQF